MPEDVRHVVRDRRLTPEEIEHYRELRAKIEGELPDIKALGRALRDRPRGVPLSKIAKVLKEEREKQGLSLDDIVRRAGLQREVLMALEDDPDSDPTIMLLASYASALGIKVELNVVP
jgi:DNA-binding XRE family transcriptional regulator